jgi:hypothetical protein
MRPFDQVRIDGRCASSSTSHACWRDVHRRALGNGGGWDAHLVEQKTMGFGVLDPAVTALPNGGGGSQNREVSLAIDNDGGEQLHVGAASGDVPG